jgi:glycosyltransferase involved in cell wall biosynthesis
MPDVSVILSTFNRADVLDGALNALVHQRNHGVTFEVVIVDNDSTDGTDALVDSWVGKYPFIRYAHEARRGVSCGRNKGATLASAPIFAFTDDDVRATPNWIVTVKDSFDQADDISFVGGKVLPVWSGSPPSWFTWAHSGPLGLLDFGERRMRIGKDRALCLLSANLAVRREAFEAVGGFSPAFMRSQDHELLIRLWRSGRMGEYRPDLVVHAIVPEERLKKSYHLMWHRRNALYHALMEPSDYFWTSDPTSSSPIFVCGVPTFAYRQWAHEVGRTLLACTAGTAAYFTHRTRATHLFHYIVQRFRRHQTTAKTSLLSDLHAGLTALVLRKAAGWTRHVNVKASHEHR